MSALSIYRILEHPAVYRLAQFLVAPGFHGPFLGKIREVSQLVPRGTSVADVGCGPKSWTWEIGLEPLGVDVWPAYTAAYKKAGMPAVTASIVALPFRNRVFDGLWCFATLHHLSDAEARGAVRELVRTCKPGGYIVVWDPMLPAQAWRRPIAWMIRRLDRGGRIRSEASLRALFDETGGWQFHHLRYTVYGLEGLFCVKIC